MDGLKHALPLHRCFKPVFCERIYMGIFDFKKRQSSLQEEDQCCLFCEYARIEDEDGAVLCQKKGKSREGTDCCASFAYDLLKRRPAAPVKEIDFEFIDL